MDGSPALEALNLLQLRSVTLDDRALMREVIAALLSDTAIQVEAIRRAIEGADARQCARLAHGLMGACANVGAVSLAALFSSVERQASRGVLSRCALQMEPLLQELENLRRAAEAI
jgi:HPt (histidine-containing phosphotransfer) domain-containing protein